MSRTSANEKRNAWRYWFSWLLTRDTPESSASTLAARVVFQPPPSHLEPAARVACSTSTVASFKKLVTRPASKKNLDQAVLKTCWSELVSSNQSKLVEDSAIVCTKGELITANSGNKKQ
jgi:hypothetical protein